MSAILTERPIAVQATSVSIAFGPPERALFGWYHPPRSAPRNCAVLLCSPVGWEALATQRTYRELAERLSEAGFPTLRFDLDGTGDSAGADDDAARVASWLGSIGVAAAQLRALSGLHQLSFFGIELGATLAATAAAAEAGVSSVVLWGPYLQGKQLSRQIRAYAALNGGEPSAAGDQEAGGFLFRAETIEAIARLDLLTSKPAAERVLLLQKNAGTNEEKLAAVWRERGARVACEAHDGYGEMMQESRKSRVPVEVLERVVSWLSAEHPRKPAREWAAAAAAPGLLRGVRGPGFQEQPWSFGPDRRYFGIITRATRADGDRPAVVFLNTSCDYRVGPSRMYVTLSRQLAGLGFSSLRFDPTGIGDHGDPPTDDAASAYSPTRLHDVTVALDCLESQGVAKRFILVGLCSAAYVAFQAALDDDRVVGEVLINPQTFFWKPGDSLEVKIRTSFPSTRYYKRALRNPNTWKRALAGRVDLLCVGRMLARRTGARVWRTLTGAIPFGSAMGFRVDRAFETLLGRGSHVLLIFDEHDGGRDVFDMHVGSDGGKLRGHPRFRLDIVRGANHTFSRVRDQQTLFALLREHLKEAFPPRAA